MLGVGVSKNRPDGQETQDIVYTGSLHLYVKLLLITLSKSTNIKIEFVILKYENTYKLFLISILIRNFVPSQFETRT